MATLGWLPLQEYANPSTAEDNSMSRKNHEWILKSRPQGLVKNTDFEYRESDEPPLQDGESL